MTSTETKTNVMYRPLGMRLDVMRSARWERTGVDCTANGITARHEDLMLIGVVTDAANSIGQRIVKPLPADMRVFPLFDPKVPGTRMTYRDVSPVALHPGNAAGCAFLAPVEWSERGQFWTAPRGMAGGNYAATSDSRVSELVEKINGARFYGALSVHDRFEH